MTLALPREFCLRIEMEARAAYPGECCGLIEGVRDGDTARALALHTARNIAAARDRFEIHPEDHFAALRAARARGHAIIGCYHSHPDGAPLPSDTDLSGAGEEGFVWLIVALSNADAPASFGAFVYRAGSLEPIKSRQADGEGLAAPPDGGRADRPRTA
jgi:proteasome lid subunit RPN8/RPN11